MTDKTDIAALREAAELLDGDEWHAEGSSVYGGAYDSGECVCYDLIASCEAVNGESLAAEFIALANPATIIAILDQLEVERQLREAATYQIKTLSGTVDVVEKQRDHWKQRAEAAEQKLKLKSEKLTDCESALEAAEKERDDLSRQNKDTVTALLREIAELRSKLANSVVLPEAYEARMGGNYEIELVGTPNGEVYTVEDVQAAIRAAGFMVQK